MKQSHLFLILTSLLLLLSQNAMAEGAEKQYKYCFKVYFADGDQIKSATVTGYDHPWWKLFRPREIHSENFTSAGQRKCWKSDLPEMGIAMSYTLKKPQQNTLEFRCRNAPDAMTKYKAKTWNLHIRKKRSDESYPIDCKIK